MLALAVVLHGLGLLVVLPDLAPTQRTSPKKISLFRPLFESPGEDSKTLQQAAVASRAEPVEQQPERNVAEGAIEPPLTEPVGASPSAQQLIEQTLLQAEALVPIRPPERSIIDGKPVPRLPGTQGWLNQFTGAVSPSQDSWLEADGAASARVVSASGEIYCGRRRAPSAAEEFNPWMSAALMLWKSCGRQRPEPTDTQDPWRRGGKLPSQSGL